jgi:hypothetical protein
MSSEEIKDVAFALQQCDPIVNYTNYEFLFPLSTVSFFAPERSDLSA